MKLRPYLKSVKYFTSKPHNDIDGHIHSTASPDAFLTINAIIKQAKENKLSYIAITDHNTCVNIDNYMRSLGANDNEIYVTQDGIKIICGAEVTCFFKHSDKYSQKLHILCYGFNRDPNNDFMRLLDSKYKDYEETFLTIPDTLAHYYPLYKKRYTKEEFKYFVYKRRLMDNKNTHSTYSPDEVVQYFVHKGLDEGQIRNDILNLAHCFKEKDNIVLDVKTVIDAVHKAGGKCMIAHPLKSYKKFMKKYKCNKNNQWAYITSMTNKLLAMGIDGVELISVTDDKNPLKAKFNDEYKYVGFTAYGSDRHDNTPYSLPLGHLSGYTPPCNFKKVIEELQKNQLDKFTCAPSTKKDSMELLSLK